MLPLHTATLSAIAVLLTAVSAIAPAQSLPLPNPPQTLARADRLADLEPEVGVIRRIRQGDSMCYISFTDEFGKRRQVGATFEFCENPRQYLNQRMRLVYGIRSVNDCPSEEPCGRSRRTHLVIRMDPVDQVGRPVSTTDSVVLRNRDWTIAIGNRNSWSGVNGTGNMTYRACNTRGECLRLSGGVTTCRDGLCATTWRNGAFSYTLNSPMTEGSSRIASTLVVRRNGNVLQEITGLL